MFLCFGGALTGSQTELWYSLMSLKVLRVSLQMSQVLPATASLSSSSPGSESMDAKKTLLFAMAQKQQVPLAAWLSRNLFCSWWAWMCFLESATWIPNNRQGPFVPLSDWGSECLLTQFVSADLVLSCKPYGLILVRLSFSFCMTHQPVSHIWTILYIIFRT